MNLTLRPAHPDNYERARRGQRVDRIVVHLMAGTMSGTAAWFGNPASRVSAHYGVSATGEVHEYVPEEHTAWHAGDAAVNRRSVGIEHEGDHPPGGDWRPSRLQFEASARLAAGICRRHGITPSAETIVPHSAVSSRKPRCPGPGFDLAAYISAVRGFIAEEQRLAGEASYDPVPVRLFDPVENVQIGEGTLVTNTDKVYVKRIGPVTVTPAAASGASVAPKEEAMRKVIEDIWNSGPLGKVALGIIGGVIVVLLLLVLSGRAFAQATAPELLSPSTWFTSVEAVLAIAGVIAGYVTKLTTALGKDWFNTEGQATVILSAVIAAIIGGVGGYLALGTFAGAGGIGGAVAAIGTALIAFLGSNASAKADRQALAGAVNRIEALEEQRTKARLL